MGADILTLADAVVAELNAHDFTSPFTAVQKLLPDVELQDMDTLHVTVVPQGRDYRQASRAALERGLTVDIGIQIRPSTLSDAVVDLYLDLVEEINDFLRATSLAGFSAAWWASSENTPIYSDVHLHELRQFTSILRTTYTTIR